MDRLYPLRLFLKRLPILLPLGFGLLLNMAAWVWLGFTILPLKEEQIFLHYTILFGVDLVGPPKDILFLPFFGFGILLINGGLGWLAFSKDRLISYMLAIAACLCQIFLGIAAALLIFLNV